MHNLKWSFNPFPAPLTFSRCKTDKTVGLAGHAVRFVEFLEHSGLAGKRQYWQMQHKQRNRDYHVEAPGQANAKLRHLDQ